MNSLFRTSTKGILKGICGTVLGTAIILTGIETKPQISISDNAESSPKIGLQLNIASAEAQLSIAQMEREAHRQINQYRRQRRLPPLRLNSRISAIARRHSQNMARKRVPFGHAGSQSRYQQIFRIVSNPRGAAENVAYNQGHSDPTTVAVRGWIKSPGHHRNLTGQFQETGIGIARNSRGEYYFTQLFARSAGSNSPSRTPSSSPSRPPSRPPSRRISRTPSFRKPYCTVSSRKGGAWWTWTQSTKRQSCNTARSKVRGFRQNVNTQRSGFYKANGSNRAQLFCNQGRKRVTGMGSAVFTNGINTAKRLNWNGCTLRIIN